MEDGMVEITRKDNTDAAPRPYWRGPA